MNIKDLIRCSSNWFHDIKSICITLHSWHCWVLAQWSCKFLIFIFIVRSMRKSLKIIKVESPVIAGKKNGKKGTILKCEKLWYYKCNSIQEMKKHADLIHDIEKSVDGEQTFPNSTSIMHIWGIEPISMKLLIYK